MNMSSAPSSQGILTRRATAVLRHAAYLAVLVSSCRSIPICDGAPPSARGAHSQAEGVLSSAEVVRSYQASNDSDRPILALSGGAMKGAFGAGFVNGWADSAKGFPHFAVVCGISTGALIAPFAFLGDTESLHAVGHLYQNVDHSDLFSPRCLLSAVLFHDSLATAEGLSNLVHEALDDDVLRRIGDEFPKGRSLLIGTVNLNTGKFCPWNITELAANGSSEFERIRTIILASASQPVLLPPYCIDHEPHSDGGARRQVFFEAPEIEAALAASKPLVYAVINGSLDTRLVGNTKKSLLDVAARSIDALTHEAVFGNLFRMAWQADRMGFGLKYTYIEWDELQHYPNSFEFTKEDMRRLYAYGYERGHLQAWESGIDNLCQGTGYLSR